MTVAIDPYRPPRENVSESVDTVVGVRRSLPNLRRFLLFVGATYLLVTLADFVVEGLLFPFAIYDGRLVGLVSFGLLVVLIVATMSRLVDRDRSRFACIIALGLFAYGYVSTNGSTVGITIRGGSGYPSTACCWTMFVLPAFGLLAVSSRNFASTSSQDAG